MTNFTLFRRFDNYIEAHIVKSRLEEQGLHCILMDDTTFSAWGGAVGRIQMLVPEAEHRAALEILIEDEVAYENKKITPGFNDDEDEQLDPANRVCIHCGSKNTRRKEDDKDSPFLSWLFSKVSHKSLINSDEWHCFHCGKDF